MVVMVKLKKLSAGGGVHGRSFSTLIFLIFLSSFLFSSCFVSAQTDDGRNKPRICTSLAPAEKTVLQNIGSIIGKKNWNFSVDPCSGKSGWVDLTPLKGFENDVQCTDPENTTRPTNLADCYVSSILLKGQSLAGTLPKELINLKQLRQLDLTRNYLNGTIPKEWAALRIVNISLMGNRLSGPIPKELSNISTLKNISLEGNQFSGEIPPEIGKLIHLERLVLSSNNLSGELPQTLERLSNMTEFKISDNAFSGKIPEYIGKWKKLSILEIQGTNLVGPIPSGISNLTKLTKLIISGITGTSSNFPNISQMASLKTLVLRNCMLFGPIPGDIGALKSLKILDLTFNNLTGDVPKSLGSTKLKFLFLTSNGLTGSLNEVESSTINIDQRDLSYNNFTETANDTSCSQNLNIVKSVKAWEKENIIHSCLRGSCKKPKYLSFHVNCGSQSSVTIGKNIFNGDDERRPNSAFFSNNENWAFSNTGTFLDNDNDNDQFSVTGNPRNVPEAEEELYKAARISPISLKYYGLCLYNGNYTVNLYFAEIVITDDKTFRSLGNRIFNIYIQGKLEKKDFNIKKAAGASNTSVVLNFTGVSVTNNTLEIHFFWDGKGTTGIPARGVYGPLVSAISVEAEFSKPKDMKMIIGIVSGCLSIILLILLVVGILWKVGYLRRQQEPDFALGKLDLQTGSFTLRQIKAATKNFDAVNKIGEGGFGSVYKGHLSDGTIIAVKQLSSKSKQGSREFITEIGLISGLQHPNLVKLYGCCTEGRELLLVYEYMENNSLAHVLFGRTENKLKLDWPTRRQICIGIARGLAYLHEESTLKIVHRDIKCTNILLDKDLNAKISDFGLAKLDEEEDTHISTRIAGTFGYMAPEYAMRGHLTYKADVYSFGVVALEIVSGKSNASSKQSEEGYYLLDQAFVLQDRGDLLELVDPEMGSNYSEEEALIMLNVALLCTNSSPSLRPTMSMALSMLEGRMAVTTLPSEPASSSAYLSKRKSREFSQGIRKPSRSQSWSYNHSSEMQWTMSSVSGPKTNDGSEYLLAESSLEIYRSP